MSDLVVESLASRRGGRTVFSGVGFVLQRGQVLLLTGSNGSGKTTLLRTLALLLPATAGRIVWEGREVFGDRDRWHAALGWLGHADTIKGDLTVAETLTYGAVLGPGPRISLGSVWDERCGECLEAFGLRDLADTACRRLSAGQRRRVGLAGLVARAAPVWLLDEPTAALDARSKASLHAAIGRHCNAGGLAVIASHGDVEIAGAAMLDLDAHRAVPEPHIDS